jgi:ATP-dependent helicase/nuclease subunit A
MGNTQWTDEQLDAITEKNCSLLVAAAAGAGKTAVLVERIIRKITDPHDPIDIDRLLIVTFTNAAAAEMRERIGDAIAEALEKDPGSARIRRQLTLLGKAAIMTIHSFCLEAIRSNFQALDIDPGFRVADEAESSLMKMEALNELFEEQYEREDRDDFLDLLESYGGNRDDQALMDMVLNLYNFIQSSPWPERRLMEMTEMLNIPEDADFGKTPWGSVLLSAVSLELEALKEIASRALEIIRQADGLESYEPVFRKDYERICGFLSLLDGAPDSEPGSASESGTGEAHEKSAWDMIHLALQGLDFDRLPAKVGKDADKEKQEAVKKLRDNVKAGIARIREKMVTGRSYEVIRDLNSLYPRMKCLAGLVIGLAQKYNEKKNRKSVLDFNDLEHLCLDILIEKGEDGAVRPSPVALAYRERFEEVLVDEYQDSNMVQEILIGMISKTDAGCPNVFMVGDVKQSIYRFRQARPELFLHKYNTYSPCKGSLFRKILLFKNFRSRSQVVDAVNYIFKQIMSVNAGELDYTDEEALNAGAVYPDCPENAVAGGEAELLLVQTGNSETLDSRSRYSDVGEDEDDAQEGEFLDKIQCEARLVAGRILELLSPDLNGSAFHVWDKSRKEYRRLEFRDIVILLRTTKNWIDVFLEELAAVGIPAYADTGSGFFKTVEVQVMLSLLQVIDNPLQDIPLLSVLRSPIFSFSADELVDLRLADRKAPLFHALMKLAETGKGAVRDKAVDVIGKLERWREMSLYLTTDRLLWRLYDETGYYGMVGALPMGEQRQANLRILFERAGQFENTSYKGLFNFINFMERIRSGRSDMGSAKILGENDNVVRLMSIHKSKGLEFPVVILSGCGKKINFQDMNKSVLLHQDLGFGPDVVDHKLRVSWPSAAKHAIRVKIHAETLSEEMRILYTALTRAREKLIITGSVNDAGKSIEKWMETANAPGERLPAHSILKGTTYMDWIGPALLRHASCADLRNLAPAGGSLTGPLIQDSSVWRIAVKYKSDIPGVIHAQAEEGKERDILPDGLGRSDKKGEFYDEIDKRLSWKYPHEKAARIQAKFSVTELKRRFDPQLSDESGVPPENLPPLIKKPMFLEERRGLTVAEKGTVLHFTMQHLDFGNPDIEGQIEDMVSRDLLTSVQAESIDAAKIRMFLVSGLGKRMLASGAITREAPFNIEIPCGELYRDCEGEACGSETILLQGVIDCFFEEPDGLVLIDYKTDYVPAGREEIMRDRYGVQIGYYARALETLTGKRVKEKYIYLFTTGETIVL